MSALVVVVGHLNLQGHIDVNPVPISPLLDEIHLVQDLALREARDGQPVALEASPHEVALDLVVDYRGTSEVDVSRAVSDLLQARSVDRVQEGNLAIKCHAGSKNDRVEAAAYFGRVPVEGAPKIHQYRHGGKEVHIV